MGSLLLYSILALSTASKLDFANSHLCSLTQFGSSPITLLLCVLITCVAPYTLSSYLSWNLLLFALIYAPLTYILTWLLKNEATISEDRSQVWYYLIRYNKIGSIERIQLVLIISEPGTETFHATKQEWNCRWKE